MQYKYLIPLVTYGAILLSLTPTLAKNAIASEITFSCEDKQGIPQTIATNERGETQTVFSWQDSPLLASQNTQEICNNVATKLNNYSSEQKDLSSFVLQPNHQAGLPAICATQTGMDCDVMLFTLTPTEEPISTACETLKLILNEDIRTPVISSDSQEELEDFFAVKLFQEGDIYR